MKLPFHINPVLNYYWRSAKRYPRLLAGLAVSIPVTQVITNYLPPIILATALNRLSTHQFVAGHVWETFGGLLVAYGALVIAGVLLYRVVDFFVWRLETSVGQAMAEEVFDHYMQESAKFHANNFGGSLVSQNNKLLGGYVRTADTIMFQVLPLVIGIITSIVILAPRSPWFSVVLFVASIGYILIALRVSKPVQRLSARFAAAESEQTGHLADAVTNAMAVKGFAHETHEKQRFHKATSKTRRRLMRFARAHQIQMLALGSASRVMSWLAFIMAVVSVVSFKANIATAFLIFSYTSTVVDQLFQFSNNSLRNFNRAFGDAADMVEMLSQRPNVLDAASPEPVRIKDGEISFTDVTFAHDGNKKPIFKKLNVHIRHGEKVGLVGHSGSGKTTFTRLLLRFSDIDDGAITISGQNIAHITQADLHSNIAYVPQEPLLFHRSIAENIGYGNIDASLDEIKEAARLSHADEFIESLPEGYDTLVGERGVKLSGGQRQRIVIARAMLKPAPILVLDEATSALDSESEGLIQDSLWSLMEGRTAIVIAHRLSTIQHMNRIIVMRDGEIVEEGSHRQLIKRGGVYADLWNRQSGGFMTT